MILKNKKILVTGADGFIGSHLTEYLLSLGCDVRAFVYYNSFNSWGWLDTLDAKAKKSLDIVMGDIRDPHGVNHAVKGCDVILHLAALIAIPYSYHSPDAYVETNIRGTLNLLQAARAHGISKFVHTSTSEVYGSAQTVPIDESHRLRGQSPYAATKIGADQLAMSFYDSFDLPVSIIRPFNTYGPRQSARAIIPTVITQIASGYKQLKLGYLLPTRDFNYVADTVRGFVAVAESDRTVGEVSNVGSGYEISIGRLVKRIVKLMNAKIKIISDDKRMRPAKSEVERLCCDASKVRKLTGWKPQKPGIDGLDSGLIKTIDWFTKQENLKQYKADIYNL